MATPRVFIVRHGETEWSLNGRHTGTTELSLTAHGESRMRATGKALLGDDRLIVPSQLVHIYVSPRRRAQRTLELLDIGCRDRYPWQNHDTNHISLCRTDANAEVAQDIREWEYGEYEGLRTAEIKERRKAELGNGGRWDIWKDGCPGGESPSQVTARLDRLIADIRARFHAPLMQDADNHELASQPRDILIVAHGHILRAFAMRWIGKSLEEGPAMLLEAGGVGTLSYQHNNVEEPAILLGGAFTVTD